jgi:hypothetical protein
VHTVADIGTVAWVATVVVVDVEVVAGAVDVESTSVVDESSAAFFVRVDPSVDEDPLEPHAETSNATPTTSPKPDAMRFFTCLSLRVH